MKTNLIRWLPLLAASFGRPAVAPRIAPLENTLT
jgi:hypothetical protein